MPYLSKVPINQSRRESHKLLGSPHAMHAAVMSCFPPAAHDQAGRILWRIDQNNPATSLIVVSPHRPDFTSLVQQAGWPLSDQEQWVTRDYQPLLNRVAGGDLWRFRLQANPVKTAKDIGKPVPHVTPDQQRGWLLSRTHKHGFSIPARRPDEGVEEPQVVVSNRRTRKFRRGDSTVTIATAQFDGLLMIEDPDVFRGCLLAGIGRAKGYGCGLLTITGTHPR